MKKIFLLVVLAGVFLVVLIGTGLAFPLSGENSESRKGSFQGQIVPWGVEMLTDGSNTPSLTGNKVKVAILDSGIYTEHEDLNGKVVKSFNALSPGEEISDDFGHGTAIAGIIAANDNEIGIIGIAPETDLFDVKVLNKEGKGSTEALITAIKWCIENEVDIINVSFGFQAENSELKKAIDKALEAGIIIVAAAGNTYGFGADYPAKYEGVLSVTSIDENLKRSSSSAKGKIDFAAPGVVILATDHDGNYTLFTGTSFAAAHVTGYIARLIGNTPNPLTSAEVFELLKKDAVDLGEEGFDREYGYGLIRNSK